MTIHNIILTFSAIRFCLLLTLFLLEFHVPIMHYCACQFVDSYFLICIETQDVNGTLKTGTKKYLCYWPCSGTATSTHGHSHSTKHSVAMHMLTEK